MKLQQEKNLRNPTASEEEKERMKVEFETKLAEKEDTVAYWVPGFTKDCPFPLNYRSGGDNSAGITNNTANGRYISD